MVADLQRLVLDVAPQCPNDAGTFVAENGGILNSRKQAIL